MKYKAILFLLILSSSSCKSQEVYNKNQIFLGEYNNKNQIKIIKNDSIRFVDKKLLEQTDQFTAKDFIKTIDSLNLYFIGEGDEPFWRIKLSQNSIKMLKYDSENEVNYESKIYIDNQSGFNIMFKSTNNEVFGLIRRVDHKLDKKNACSLCITDNFLVYETFITIDKKVYKGCAMIDRID